MEARSLAFRGECHQGFGQDCERATQAGKTTVLRETPKFNRALARAWDFIDGPRDARLGNVGLVSRIVEDDGPVLEGI